MAYPAGVITRPVTFGPAFELEDGDVAGMQVTFKATRPGVLWMETGQPAVSTQIVKTADDGVEQTVYLPVTDQDGWGDGDGNLIVPGADGHVFLYIVTVIFTQNGRTIPGAQPRSKVVPIPQGDLTPLDLDKLIPLTTPGGTVVSVPDIWSEQIAAAEAAAVAAAESMIDSDTFMASKADDPTSEFAASLSAKIEPLVPDAGTPAVGDDQVRPVGKGELLFNVRDFGALGDGTADDTAAIQAAITAATATTGNRYGSVVLFPGSSGPYRYSKLDVLAAREASLTLRGSGNACLRPIASADNLGPSIHIRPTVAPTEIGNGYLRHVRVENLTISGTGYVYADSRTNSGDADPYSNHRKRVGVQIDTAVNVSFNNSWITHFRKGLVLRDVFDSEFQNTQFLHCGYSLNDAVVDDDFTTGYGYSVELTEFPGLDCSNALKFTNCHFEGGPLFVRFTGGSRQNNFTGCKFENRTPTADDGSSVSAIWFDDAIENQFTACMFTEDFTRGKHFVRADTTDTSYNTTYNVRQAALFSACIFAANMSSKALWFRGSYAKIVGCSFNRTDGGAASYPFIFGSHCVLLGNTITLADLNIGVARFGSRYNTFKHNTIIGFTGTSVGALYFLDAAAVNNYVEDNETSGTFGTLLSTTLTDLGSNIFAKRSTPNKPLTAGSATPNVFMTTILTLTYSSATNVTNFSAGHAGQRVFVRATNGNITFVHGASTIYLKSGANKTLASGEGIEFINDAGVWREV